MLSRVSKLGLCWPDATLTVLSYHRKTWSKTQQREEVAYRLYPPLFLSLESERDDMSVISAAHTSTTDIIRVVPNATRIV